MRRVAYLLALLVVFSLLPIAGSTRAQQATPVPSTGVEQPEQSQEFEPLAFSLLGPTPPAPAFVFLARFTFTPGAATGGGADPGPTLAYVEAGEIVVSAQGEAYVLPGEAGDAPPLPQPIPPGADAMLQAGDALIVPMGTATQVRNEGAEEATVLVLGVFPGDPRAGLQSPGESGVTIEPLAIGAVDESAAGGGRRRPGPGDLRAGAGRRGADQQRRRARGLPRVRRDRLHGRIRLGHDLPGRDPPPPRPPPAPRRSPAPRRRSPPATR